MTNPDDPKVAAAIAEARRTNEEAVEHHPVVSQEEWVKQRLKLMEKEKQYLRAGDALAAEVRALPWVKVEKSYLFTSPQGDLTLAGPLQAASSAIGQALHDGTRTGVAVSGLLARNGPYRRSATALRTSRPGVCSRVAGAHRRNRSCARADGVEVLLAIVVQIRLQLRLPCVVPAGGGQGGKDDL